MADGCGKRKARKEGGEHGLHVLMRQGAWQINDWLGWHEIDGWRGAVACMCEVGACCKAAGGHVNEVWWQLAGFD